MLVSNRVAESSKRSTQGIVNDVKKLSLAATTCSHRSQNRHGRLTLPGFAIPGAVSSSFRCVRGQPHVANAVYAVVLRSASTSHTRFR